MITLRSVHKSFGGNTVLAGIDWVIPQGARIGLIGANGAGKTTLLLIIKGDMEPDEGEVVKRPSLRIGYLPQEPILFQSDRGVVDEAMRGRSDLLEMEERLAEIESRMANAEGKELDRLIREHAALRQEFEKAGGYALRSEALKVLRGLGFDEVLIKKRVSELSGGFRARLELAKLLLSEPDVLLLDEPTNNLDIPSLIWLENYLKNFKGTFIVVSHDRYLLDKVVDEIVELERGKLYFYSGNYSKYVVEKRRREELLREKWKEYEREKAKLIRFIERYKAYKDKARLVRDRKKKLEKLEPPPEIIERRGFKIRVRSVRRLPKLVVKLHRVCKGFSGISVLKDIDLEIHRGDRIALMGPNGRGKSTLISIIAGRLKPDSGDVYISDGVEIGYFAQSQTEVLDPTLTVLETMEKEAEEMTLWEIRRLLGAFLFSDDDVFKTVGELSGGERARLALALVFAKPRNFLLLDEPTNHLDIATREALEEALINFDGAYLIVSHDRYFVEKTANKILYLDEELFVFHGRYSEYEKILSRGEIRKPAKKEKPRRERKPDELRIKRRKIRRLREELEKIEARLEELESEKKLIEEELANPDLYRDGEEAREKVTRYEVLKKELDDLYRKWEELMIKLEKEEREYEDERAKRISR